MKKLIPILLLVPLLIAGCYPGAPITIGGGTPTISSFNASPASISAGQSSSLNWSVSNATMVTIDQGIGNVALTGTRAVAPAATTTYTLTASSTAGSITATTQVIVAGAAPPVTPTGLPVINSFIASPSGISVGDSTSLSWNVSNATSIYIDNGIGSVGSSGNTIILPLVTTTYTLTASNSAGSSTATALVLVSGVPSPSSGLPVINYFDASPPVITGGSGSTLLRWNVSYASSVTIDNGIGPVGSSGTILVTLAASTNYTLTATNAYGWRTQTLSVLVSGAPPPPSFAVTSVTASTSPPSYSGPCPYQFTFSATITVNGPGTVTYKWERDDNASAPVQSVTFASAGSQMVTTTWYLGGTGSGWERVHILTPNNTVSNEAFYLLNCL